MINTWLSKKKGSTLFDLMTMSDIPYTVVVLENSYEIWDQEYSKKKMSRTEWELYMKSEDSAIKKPKYTDQMGKKREYCNLGWSKDELNSKMRQESNGGILPSLITVAYSQTLRELGPIILEACTVKRIHISSNTPDKEEAQVEELPANRFCAWDEMNNCPWKENKTGKDNEDGSDYDNECSGPQKRAKEGNHHLPWVSAGSDATALSQHEIKEEYGGISDGEEVRWCGI
jgi:hypothetical protein